MDNMNNNVNVEPAYNATPAAPAQDNSMKAMIFGILSVALAGVVGLIFAILGKKEVALYQANFGALTGKAKVAGILTKIGFIVSIVAIVIYVIYFFIGFALGFASMSY